ncbi:MAG: hypothetical protein CSB55_03465 [Candidatus Cloacimonadota bacterium]|nr:MAG: hypothetical protein CSB55_03465 [Candidatus Cloacimonadota bacterium]
MQYDIERYILLIQEIRKNGYDFSFFNSVSDYSVILRHDIDISPQLALQMAKTENDLGVKSTYFFMLRSPFYNVFSRANNEIIKAIISLGHRIGLHYDDGYFSKNEDLQNLINTETEIFKSNFNTNIDAVSFHQPSQHVIDNKINIKQINTYDKIFFKDIKYLSDSNMNFKEDPFDIIKSKKFPKIQLLIHPVWWIIAGSEKTTEEKFISAMKINFALEQQQVVGTERAYGKAKEINFE